MPASTDRNVTRALTAHTKTLAAGGTAFQAALAAIDAGFGIEAVHDQRKRRARRNMRLGVCFETYGRFGFLADYAVVRNFDIDMALLVLGNLAKQAARRPSVVINGRSVNADTIRTVRLILRVLRFTGRAEEFNLIAAGLCLWPDAPAFRANATRRDLEHVS